MSDETQPDDRNLAQMLVLNKIIAGSLIFGVIAFATVTVALRLGQEPEQNSTISIIAAAFAAVTVVVRQVVLGVMNGHAVPKPSVAPSPQNTSLGLFQVRMIVGLAVLEGAAFFNLIAYLLEGHWWTFLIVAGLLAWMLASFPTRSRLRQWIEDREQLKSLGQNLSS